MSQEVFHQPIKPSSTTETTMRTIEINRRDCVPPPLSLERQPLHFQSKSVVLHKENVIKVSSQDAFHQPMKPSITTDKNLRTIESNRRDCVLPPLSLEREQALSPSQIRVRIRLSDRMIMAKLSEKQSYKDKLYLKRQKALDHRELVCMLGQKTMCLKKFEIRERRAAFCSRPSYVSKLAPTAKQLRPVYGRHHSAMALV